jgi:hypothetical protein
VTEHTAGQQQSENDPPAHNQPKSEPVASNPDDSSQAGPSGAGAGRSSDAADAGTLRDEATGGVPSPGNAAGVHVPSVQSAAGTSEELDEVDSTDRIANAAPGKPDGEVDTRA